MTIASTASRRVITYRFFSVAFVALPRTAFAPMSLDVKREHPLRTACVARRET
jgi:hypothetical protein